MTHRIASARARSDLTVEIEWREGGSDVVDFGPIVARGGVMSRLGDRRFFVEAMRVEPDGYGLGWPSEPANPNEASGIDFSASGLWYRAHPDELAKDLGDAAA